MSERLPPHNPEAEKSVLGALLISREAAATIMEDLREEDFFRMEHRHIFAASMSLYARAEDIDMVTLSSELRRRQHLDTIGGFEMLTELGLSVPTTANLGTYIREVRDQSTLRQLISTSSKITNQALAAMESVEDIINEAERDILEIGSRTNAQKPYASIGDILTSTYETMEQQAFNKGGVVGVPTGFERFDGLTSGLQKSDLIIVAARPGVGKSTMLLNIVQHAAQRCGIPSVFFSLEMSRDQLAQRLLCSEAEIDLYNLRGGYLQTEDWNRIVQAIGPLAASPIYIDDTPSLSVIDLRSRVRRMKLEHGIGLVVIDYLQLMTLGGRPENRQQEISFISRALKALAKELDIPVVVASQLNRAVEQRNDKRPMLSDLLESGGIEANADLVVFLYRDDYYNSETEKKDIVEIILAKQRNGPTGTVELFFLKKFNKFVNLAASDN